MGVYVYRSAFGRAARYRITTQSDCNFLRGRGQHECQVQTRLPLLPAVPVGSSAFSGDSGTPPLTKTRVKRSGGLTMLLHLEIKTGDPAMKKYILAVLVAGALATS